MDTATHNVSVGEKVYRADVNPFTGEVDPAFFTAVRILAIGTRADGSRFADYAASGYGARGDLDQFVPRSAVKRVTVDGRRRLVWC